MYWKAKSLFEIKLYNDSKDTLEFFFRKASVDNNYYEDARFLYCKIFYKLEKYNDALLLFNQFLRNTTFNFYRDSSYFWLGEIYLQLSSYDLA